MGVIQDIYNSLTESKELSFHIFSDEEMAIYLWEREFPITVNLKTDEIYVDTEGLSFQLPIEMMEEIVKIMFIIHENIDEIRCWVRG